MNFLDFDNAFDNAEGKGLNKKCSYSVNRDI